MLSPVAAVNSVTMNTAMSTSAMVPRRRLEIIRGGLGACARVSIGRRAVDQNQHDCDIRVVSCPRGSEVSGVTICAQTYCRALSPERRGTEWRSIGRGEATKSG